MDEPYLYLIMRKGALNAVHSCMGVEEAEAVVVVSDPERKEIADVIAEVAGEVTEVEYVEMDADARHGEEPPGFVADEMLEADVVFCVTTRSLTHTDARVDACSAGARVASMPMITEKVMRGAMTADYQVVKKRADSLLDALVEVDEIEITSDAGMDMVFRVGDREWMGDTGICHEPGCVTNLPAGEVYISPETGDGVTVIDGSMAGIGLIEESISIEFRDGAAVDVSNEELRGLMKDAGRCGYQLAELGIGVNPEAGLIGNVLQDEKSSGTIHVAVGDSAGIGGDTRCDIHLDGVVTEPVLYLDGEEFHLEDLF